MIMPLLSYWPSWLSRHWLLITALLACSYFFLALSIDILFANHGLMPSPIWPSAAIAFVGVWLWQKKAWTGIFLGAFLSNWLYGEANLPIWAAGTIALGSLFAATLANYLLSKFTKPYHLPFFKIEEVIPFLVLVGILQAIIAATIGVASKHIALQLNSDSFLSDWLKWGIADATGALMLAPLLMLIIKKSPVTTISVSPTEAITASFATLLLAFSIFWLANDLSYASYALPFLLIGPLAWISVRFPLALTLKVLFLKDIISYTGTLLGLGVLNTTINNYPIGTLSIITFCGIAGVHFVTALIYELRASHDALVTANNELEQKISERTASLIAKEKHLLKMVEKDDLTQLASRRHFQEQTQQNIAQALNHRQEVQLSYLLFDIDHFKEINDQYGHATGDMVLKAIGQNVPKLLRHHDIAGRVGGEEFAILLPDTSIEQARLLAERLRFSLSQTIFISQNNPEETFHVTISIGVTDLKPSDEDNQTELIDIIFSRADKALYQAKNTGRNRVCVL